MTKKEERKLNIKECARKLIIEKNIEQTTYQEIALKAGVGEATVYRHYANKGKLVMDIAMDYAIDFSSQLTKIINNCRGSHLDKFEKVLDYYIKLYKDKPDYFIYLEHFDNYVVHCDKPLDNFEKYEYTFKEVSKVICDLSAGEQVDNSVRKDLDLELATYTINITFVSLCQKLLLRGRIIEEDNIYDNLKELTLMKNIMIDSLKY